MSFFDYINIYTGEIRTTNFKGDKITPHKKAYYKSLLFKIYDTGTITIEGSLHKYWNNGKHNFNDFKYYDLNDVLNDFRLLFNITPQQCIIRQIELGLNINPTQETNQIIEHCFIHKRKPFVFKYHNDEGRYKQCRHSQYVVKIYNKRLHYLKQGYHIPNEILRFEIKYLKMERLNRKGIFKLSDLLNFGLENLEDAIINEWTNILFYDYTIKHKSKRLLNYCNPNYWTQLIDYKSTSTYGKHRRFLKDFILNYSDNIQQQIEQLLKAKFREVTRKGIRIDPLYIMSIQVPLLSNTDEVSSSWFIDNETLSNKQNL